MARSFGSALLRARRTLTPIETLDVSPVTTLAQAYEAQRALVDDSGASVAGYKIGACSKAAQDSIALSCPIAGHILADAVHASPAEVTLSKFNVLKIEPEYAFCMKTALPARTEPYSEAEVSAAIASVHAAFEIVASAFVDARQVAPAGTAGLCFIADNGVHGGLVVGDAHAWTPSEAHSWLTSDTVTLSRDATQIDSGNGANAMGHPLTSLTWLANNLSMVNAARGLQAGDYILSGVLTQVHPISTSALFSADFGRLGVISLNVL